MTPHMTGMRWATLLRAVLLRACRPAHRRAPVLLRYGSVVVEHVRCVLPGGCHRSVTSGMPSLAAPCTGLANEEGAEGVWCYAMPCWVRGAEPVSG